jgi:hypothetical protein
MLPIIHRRREPLLPPDPPKEPGLGEQIPSPKHENRSDSGQFRSDSESSQPEGSNESSPTDGSRQESVSQAPLRAVPNTHDPFLGNLKSPLVISGNLHGAPNAIEPPKTENRSDSGQFRSENSPPSLPSISQQLWSRRQSESAVDYQLFTAWLQLAAPRHFRKAAESLGCSVYRLRRLAALHDWKSRAAAFDNFRALLASQALEQLLSDEKLNWQERAERFRNQEWALHEEMLHSAFQILQDLKNRPRRSSLKDLLALLDLASVLGRRATGLPLDPAAASTKPQEYEPHYDAEYALNKIYGSDSSTDAGEPCDKPS